MRSFAIAALIVLVFSQCSESNFENAKELKKVTQKLNKNCPQMIDSETRLDAIGMKDPNTLFYKYTLINLSVQNLDTLQFYKAMWPGLVSTIKLSPEMEKLRENDVVFEYDYKDKANKTVYVFKITPKDYKQ